MFFGIDLVKNRETREPHPAAAEHILSILKEVNNLNVILLEFISISLFVFRRESCFSLMDLTTMFLNSRVLLCSMRTMLRLS